MKFGYQNELRAYNERIRSQRINAAIAKLIGIGLVATIVLAALS